MPFTTVPYQFVNSLSVPSDADKVDANNQAIIDGLSDGTKDLNIGTLSASGVVMTGALPKTTDFYNIGSAIKRYKDAYIYSPTVVNLSASTELQGDIANLTVGSVITDGIAADSYMGPAGFTSSEAHFICHRAGSIKAMQISGYLSTYAAPSWVFAIELYKNGARAGSSDLTSFYKTMTVSASGAFSGSKTGGTFTFVAGDRISARYMHSSGGTHTGMIRVDAIIQWST